VETLCGGGIGYVFDGGCVPYESRVEIINVKGASPIALTVRRSVHGPVVGSGPNVRFARRRAQWKREVDYIKAVFGASRARNLDEFRVLVEQRSGVAGVLYADNSGNIAFWLAGWLPERASGFDTRFPLPGNGSAEWTGARLPVPVSINPAQGWLANWNNKPSVDFDALEGGGLGRSNRVLDIASLLDRPSPVSPDGMNVVVKDVARVDVVPTGPGRQSRFLKPYLLSALDAVPPVHPLAPDARTVLENWDGSAIAEAMTSTSLEPGYVIFKKWLAIVLQDVFSDELKGNISQANASVLLHVLDDALRQDGPCADLGGSCVPPSRDYLNGQDANDILSHAFDQAITFSHFLIGPMAQIPGMARMTWAQNLVLAHPISGETILGLGESGFIKSGDGGVPVPDPHFADQLQLYQNFGYKPMPLYRNWQLEP
jgi:penicillin amidase